MTETAPEPQPTNPDGTLIPTPETDEVDRLAEGIAKGVTAGLRAKPGPVETVEVEKPVEWKAGDKVRSIQGHQLVVISQGAPGSAVHCESAEKDAKPYINTYFAADTLKKAR
ncbi:hypothetical protein [Aeromicrobium fastidiosum]|uniref:Uncharacterized protein n=1 Tax=Aeromicrobium fastidiosum TaxID=52699 RepID=A0A641AU07_9ACTN|nr:hypothetical protein [Aeromicrobium fastidiosum]KAA1380511.1 hypothetical protein ESP62_004865 [Aeromicrobium fastidiosum]MBP2390101.1 hypothetical protein [Aeromicrobium fastidiosum]